MKIILCLNQDIYCHYLLNSVLDLLKQHEVKIYFSNKTEINSKDSKKFQKLQEIEYDLSATNISLLLEKLENDDFKKNNSLTFSQISETHSFEILNFKNINQDGFEYLQQNWQPDLILSIRFKQIFQKQLISLPKLGIINLHSGILPNYRGLMSTFWSMLSNEKEIGSTLHFINDQSIDTGDIINVSRIKANYQETLVTNILRVYKDSSKTIIDTINRLENDLSVSKVKQGAGGKYFSCPSKENPKNYNFRLF